MKTTAQAALGEGIGSPYIWQLAFSEQLDRSEAGEVFEKALSELGLRMPSVDQALMTIVHHHAQRIVDGRVSPYDGARAIAYGTGAKHSIEETMVFTALVDQIDLWTDPQQISEHGASEASKNSAAYEANITEYAKQVLGIVQEG